MMLGHGRPSRRHDLSHPSLVAADYIEITFDNYYPAATADRLLGL